MAHTLNDALSQAIEEGPERLIACYGSLTGPCSGRNGASCFATGDQGGSHRRKRRRTPSILA